MVARKENMIFDPFNMVGWADGKHKKERPPLLWDCGVTKYIFVNVLRKSCVLTTRGRGQLLKEYHNRYLLVSGCYILNKVMYTSFYDPKYTFDVGAMFRKCEVQFF